jgi:hypothetical protein
MLAKTKIALSVALILGAASVARANDSGENHQDEDRSAVSGSAAKFNSWVGNSANASGAYGYVAAPIHKGRVHEQTQSH